MPLFCTGSGETNILNSFAKSVIISGSISANVNIIDCRVGADSTQGVGIDVNLNSGVNVNIENTLVSFNQHTPVQNTTNMAERAIGLKITDANGSINVLGSSFTYADYGIYSECQTGTGSINIGSADKPNSFNDINLISVFLNAASGASVGISVVGNTVLDAGGIYINTASNGDITVESNIIKNSSVAIDVTNSGNGEISVKNNTVEQTGIGVLINSGGTGLVKIDYNNLSYYTQYGVYIASAECESVSLIGNYLAAYNTTAEIYPVFVNLERFNSDFSLVFGNRFIQNRYNTVVINGTLQYDMYYNGDLAIFFGGIDLNGHDLTVDGMLYHLDGEIRINNGSLTVNGRYILGENGLLYLDGYDDFKRLSLSSYEFYDKDGVVCENAQITPNAYVTKQATVLNGPGEGYWQPVSPDVINGILVKVLWNENGYNYIEYPIYDQNGIFVREKRGYIPADSTGVMFNDDTANLPRYINSSTIYDMPSTQSSVLDNVDYAIEVTLIKEEDGYSLVEYYTNAEGLRRSVGLKKRGYVLNTVVKRLDEATDIILDQKTIYLDIGDSDKEEYQLKVSFEPKVATNVELEYIIPPVPDTEQSVVEIEGNGLVRAGKVGTTTITVRLKNDPDVFTTCDVFVCDSRAANTHAGELVIQRKWHDTYRQYKDHYVCPYCNAKYLMPEEQDLEVLILEDYLSVLTLQKAACFYLAQAQSDDLTQEEKERREAYYEACLRSIDKIRRYCTYKNGVGYEYIGVFGEYISPNTYYYGGTVSASVSVHEYDTQDLYIGQIALDVVNFHPYIGCAMAALEFLISNAETGDSEEGKEKTEDSEEGKEKMTLTEFSLTIPGAMDKRLGKLADQAKKVGDLARFEKLSKMKIPVHAISNVLSVLDYAVLTKDILNIPEYKSEYIVSIQLMDSYTTEEFSANYLYGKGAKYQDMDEIDSSQLCFVDTDMWEQGDGISSDTLNQFSYTNEFGYDTRMDETLA